MFKNFLFIVFSLIILTSIGNTKETLKYARVLKITSEVTTITFSTPMINNKYIIKIKAVNKRLNMNLFKVEIIDKTINGFSFKVIDKKWNMPIKNLKIRYMVFSKT